MKDDAPPSGAEPTRVPRQAGDTSGVGFLGCDHWALNTTIRCQHRCVYCFEGERRGKRDVPPEETRQLIARAAERVNVLVFMGAEPTLNPHIRDLTRYGAGLGLKICYATNGLRFASRSFLDDCFEAGLRLVDLSFHYPDAATYGAITRGKPKGFELVLRALDNLEAFNRDHPDGDRLDVSIACVVSAQNYERLPEVLAHVTSRLQAARYKVLLKRVTGLPEDERFLVRDHVPLRSLRPHLQAAFEHVAESIPIEFRGFPLCAAPGWEHRDADLGYWLGDIEVRHNFLEQGAIDEMYPVETLRGTHPYDWLCGLCAASHLCINRGIFRHGAPSPERRPVPVLERLPPRLARTVRASLRFPRLPADVAALVERSVAELLPTSNEAARPAVAADAPAAARLLAGLWTAAPPGVPLGTCGGTWAPLDSWCVRLEAGAEAALVRIGAPRNEWGAVYPAGRVVLSPTDGAIELGSPLEATLRAFAEVVAGVDVEDTGAAADPWLAAAYDAVRHCFAGPGARVLLAVEAERDRVEGLVVEEAFAADGVVRFALRRGAAGQGVAVGAVGGTLPGGADEAFRARLAALAEGIGATALRPDAGTLGRLRRLAASSGAALDPAGAVAVCAEHAFVRLAGSPVLAGCEIADDVRGERAGFLCGGLVLAPDASLLPSAEGCLWVEALGRALLAERAVAAPPGFLGAVSRTLGRTLLPRHGRDARLVAGSVTPEEVRLRFEAGGRVLDLTLHPAEHATHAFASGGGLALCFLVPDGGPLDAPLRRVADGYARLLVSRPT